MPKQKAFGGLFHQHAQPIYRLRAAGGAGPGQERHGGFAIALVSYTHLDVYKRQQLDRFLLKVLIGYPSLEDEKRMVAAVSEGKMAAEFDLSQIAQVLHLSLIHI